MKLIRLKLNLNELIYIGSHVLVFENLSCLNENVNADFYGQYWISRKVKLTGRRSLSVMGTVMNDSRGKPVEGATLRFVPVVDATDEGEERSNNKVVMKKSAAQGGFGGYMG